MCISLCPAGEVKDERKKGGDRGGGERGEGCGSRVGHCPSVHWHHTATDLQAMEASKQVSLPDMAEVLLLQREQSHYMTSTNTRDEADLQRRESVRGRGMT